MPNIADYVKFDIRSEALINQKLNEELDIIYDKHKGLTESLPYIIESEKTTNSYKEMSDRLKTKDLPIFNDKLITQIAIEWGEANNYSGYDSFTQAVKEVYKYIESKSEEVESSPDLNSDIGGISIEEAKLMLLGCERKISNRILQESLAILNPKLKNTKEIYISNEECYVSDGSNKIEIPTEIIKMYILHLDKSWNESLLTKEEILEKIKNQNIEKFYDVWA